MRQTLLLIVAVAMVGCGKEEAPKGEIRVKGQRVMPNTELPKATVEKLIADPIVEKAIRNKYSLNKPTGELTKADLEKVKYLDLSSNQLTELPKGLGKLTQLEELRLGKNQLTSLKGLEKLTQLEQLSLGFNQLTEVPKELEKLTQLELLYLGGNQLTSLKGLEKLTQLKDLNLEGNKLTNLKGLEKLTQLTLLSLRENQLIDVKGLENLTQLEELQLDDNQLTDVKGLEKLTQLSIVTLEDNPDLTKAQIDELKKALPNCDIWSATTK